MREVASDAGVAIETLYGYFPSKRALFQAAVDIALVGDAAPVAVADRPEFAAIGRGSHTDRTAAAARLLASVFGRSAPLIKVIREAAANDGDIADMLRGARERQRQDVRAAIELITGREATVAERDGLWAVTSPEIYLLLVEESGWTPDQYEAWMAETLAHLIPAPKHTEESR